MNTQLKKWLAWAAVGAGVVVAAVMAWLHYAAKDQNTGLAGANGRIEATEIDVAAKAAGRVTEIRVNEGDFVTAGQVVAVMDTDVLNAQLREAEAESRRAQSAIDAARSQVAQREAEKAAARAEVARLEVELRTAKAHASRSEALAAKGFLSPQAVDDDRARADSAREAVAAGRAQVAAAQAAIVSARSQLVGAQSAAAATEANIERIRANIEDTVLRSPRDGRVQYLVARVGEVVPAGGRVLNLVDLSDVYMTFFLPTALAGRVALGADVRLVLDAAPQYVIPAQVSFVADVAQFTPKTVETATEREKLMFRIRAQISPDLLRKHIKQVKTGVPGIAYVRVEPGVQWPSNLQVRLPE